MKEEEIDKFLGKDVEITFTNNQKHKGYLCRIVNSKTSTKGYEELHAINKGYAILRTNGSWLDFRKSHIKKIIAVSSGL